MCCSLFWCSTYDHYPALFITKTGWHTDEWPGQVLDKCEPKNVGTARTITYTITWQVGLGPNEEPTATISYSVSISEPNGPYYEWYDISDPPYGIAATKHYLAVLESFDKSKLDGVLFTVEPSSIAYLDPNKNSTIPVKISHMFKTILNTGDKVVLYLRVYLWLDTLEIVGVS